MILWSYVHRLTHMTTSAPLIDMPESGIEVADTEAVMVVFDKQFTYLLSDICSRLSSNGSITIW